MDIPVLTLHRLSSTKLRWQWFLFLFAALLILFVPFPSQAGVPVERVIRVEASMNGFNPAEIAVNPGDRVTVELVATDVVHGLSLDSYDFSMTAEPGQSVSKTFVADKSGTFRFRCSVPCGNLHPFVIGKLQVGQNILFLRAIGLGLLAVIAAIWMLKNSSWSRYDPNLTLNGSGKA